MQLLEIYDYWNEHIGTYILEESFTNEEMKDLEKTLITAQENADPSEYDVVDTTLFKWLDEKNLHSMSYRYDRIDMPFKKLE